MDISTLLKVVIEDRHQQNIFDYPEIGIDSVPLSGYTFFSTTGKMDF